MRKIKSKKTLLFKQCLLIAYLSAFATISFSQIHTGSFESEGQFSIEGWKFTDPYCYDASQDTPPEGGSWSLQLAMRNIQGGPLGVAYQLIPQVQNGDIWRMTAWVRQPASRRGYSSIFWTTFETDSVFNQYQYPLPYSHVDTTSADYWMMLTVIDTFYVKEGDSAGIVLDAGLTGGPTYLHDYSNFDLVIVEKIGEVIVSVDDSNHQFSDDFKLFQNFPNPFNSTTMIIYDLPRDAKVDLKIYDLLGREIRNLISDFQLKGPKSALWDGKDNSGEIVNSGLYIYALLSGDKIQNKKLLFLK